MKHPRPVGVAWLATMAVILAACGGDAADTTPVATAAPPATDAPTTTAAVTTTTTAAVTTTEAAPTTTTLPPQPASVWATNQSAGKLFHIDPDSGDILAEAAAGGGEIALAGGSVWVSSCNTNEVFRVDPDSFETTAIAVGACPGGITASDGFVWVSNFNDGTVSQIDAASGEVVATIAVSAGPAGLAGGSVYGVGFNGGEVFVIDAAGTVTQTVAVGPQLSGVDVGAGSVWISGFDGTAYRLDMSTLETSSTYSLGNNANVTKFDEGAAWITNSREGQLWKIDPSSDIAEVVTSIPVATGIGLAPGVVYVTGFSIGNVYVVPIDNPATMFDLVNIQAGAFDVLYGAP